MSFLFSLRNPHLYSLPTYNWLPSSCVFCSAFALLLCLLLLLLLFVSGLFFDPFLFFPLLSDFESTCSVFNGWKYYESNKTNFKHCHGFGCETIHTLLLLLLLLLLFQMFSKAKESPPPKNRLTIKFTFPKDMTWCISAPLVLFYLLLPASSFLPPAFSCHFSKRGCSFSNRQYLWFVHPEWNATPTNHEA